MSRCNIFVSNFLGWSYFNNIDNKKNLCDLILFKKIYHKNMLKRLRKYLMNHAYIEIHIYSYDRVPS